MVTRMHVVPRAVERPIANPAKAPSPRVLCAEVSRRLALLNGAVRRLRAWDIPVEAQRIDGAWPAEGCPMVRIRREASSSIGPLLDACPKRLYISLPTATLCLTTLDGVAVVWSEPR